MAGEDELFAMSYPGDYFSSLDSLLCSVPGEVPRTSRRLTRKRPREQPALENGVLMDEPEVNVLSPMQATE